MEPRVTIVLVNWNKGTETASCIESLRHLEYTNYNIIVVDNGSTDGSVSLLHEKCPDIPTLETGSNLGYTGGNNTGIRWAIEHEAEWVYLLNTDTTSAPDSLGCMVEAAAADPQTGIIGPTTYHADTHIIQSAGGWIGKDLAAVHRGQNQPDQGQFAAPAQVDWVSGCALLARREMIEQIGLLDDRLFMYLEEVEWCIRARRNHWKIVHVPGAHVWHSGVSMDYEPKPYVTYYMIRNQLLLQQKYHARLSTWLKTWFTLSRRTVSWSIRPYWRLKRPHRDAMLRGVTDYFRQRWGKMM